MRAAGSEKKVCGDLETGFQSRCPTVTVPSPYSSTGSTDHTSSGVGPVTSSGPTVVV